jgi:hypothetical protein
MSDHGWQHSLLQGMGTRAEVFAELHPRAYLFFMAVFALLGYGCLLLFPLLALAGLVGVCRALVSVPDIHWLSMLAWMLVAGFSGLTSYRLFQFRCPLPAGVVLERQQAPSLFQLLDDMCAHYACPRIDRVLLTDGYAIDVVDTPEQALPIRPTRSLLIGISLLQCLSMTRFQCALARRLGQSSRRNNHLLNWLYALRSIWTCYGETACGADPAYLPVRTLFALYAPLYTVLGTVAARLDELQADSYAMELFNDEDVLDAITTDAVHRLFLRERYWPAIRKLREQGAGIDASAWTRIPMVLKAGLHAGNISRHIEQAMTAEQHWDDPWPSLVRRIENIGHAEACMNPDTQEPAACTYLNIPMSKLEAALADLPPPMPVSQPWSAGMDVLRQRVQSARHGLRLRLKNLLRPHGQVGEVKH